MRRATRPDGVVEATDTRLSSTLTVQRYLELEAAEDRQALAHFIERRFEERYFVPMERRDRSKKHGFAQMAVACVVIETLESFYQGVPDTRNRSRQMFESFFARDTPLKVFAGNDDWFYTQVRCGILHQGEIRGGWRIVREGALLDVQARSINATRLLRGLRKALAAYAVQLVRDDACWTCFKKKMKAVCKNCEPPPRQSV